MTIANKKIQIIIYLSLLRSNTILNDKIMNPATFKHINCRNAEYLHSTIRRFPVPDEYVHWNIKYPEYAPISYESPSLKGKPWADSDISIIWILRVCISV